MAKTYADLVKLKDYQEIILAETLESLKATGQGAVSLFTGGGKSFIGLKIALMYLQDNPEQDVLWFGTKSANKNVYSSVIKALPPALSKRIHMKSYEQIWHGDDSLEVTPSETCLLVFDESHRSLTRYSADTILRIRDTFKCDKLAMSATQRRTSGVASFDTLTPKAIWGDYNCNWAADNEVINQIIYLVSNTKIAKFDTSELEAYKELGKIYPDIRDKCNNLEAMLDAYKFSFAKDVYQVMRDSGMSLDASKGARHIIFFSSIAELMRLKANVYDIFSKLYPGAQINVHEYHSKMSETAAKNVLNDAVNTEARPNTVDIIITVDKGTESIHPRGIKSVTICRHTQSYIKFTQQMGRGITLRDFSSDKSYIFDFSDGCVSLLRGNTIAYGRRSVDSRVYIPEVDTLESLETKLRKAISSNIKIKTTFATPKLRQLSTMLNELRDEALNRDKVGLLKLVLSEVNKHYGIAFKAMPSYKNLRELYLRGIKEGKINKLDNKYTHSITGLSTEFTMWITQMSKLIVQESLAKDSDTYKALKAMGHLIYLIDTSYEDESHLTTIDNIIAYKNKLKAKAKAKDEAGNESGAGNGDEAEIERVPTPSLGVGVNTKYYKDIMELKRLNFHDDLSVYVCTYARHNGLDISADDISLSEIKRLSSDEDKDAFIGYNKEIRAAVALKEILNSELLQSKRTNVPIEYRVRDGIDVSDDIDKIDDAQLMWAALQAWHLINGVNHKSAYANFIRHKIKEQYRYELRFRILSAKTEADGTRLVTILNNYANTNTVINGTFQEYLFSHIDFKELSLIEVMILRIYGIKTQSKYKKLLDRTGWMETYNKALDGDTVSLVQLERIDRKHLDDYRKKLISSRAFKAARINQYQDMQPSLLLKKAKSFLGDDKILQGELEKALNNGKISSESLIKAAFPDFLHKNIDYLLNLSTDEFMIEIDNGPSNRTTNFGNVYNAATSPASCVSLVLGNILSIKGIDPEVYTKASMIEEVISKK